MLQPDLFSAEDPRAFGARCGTCVHRNGRIDKPLASCTPRGWRKADDAPCSQWFGYDQLNDAIKKRPK